MRKYKITVSKMLWMVWGAKAIESLQATGCLVGVPKEEPQAVSLVVSVPESVNLPAFGGISIKSVD